MWGTAADYNARQFGLLNEKNAATQRAKTATARDEFIVQCYRAVSGLVSASTVTTNLAVDLQAVAVALADMILSSPPAR